MRCKNCETKEPVKYSKYSNGEFCSKECSRAYSTKNKRNEINAKISLKLTGTGHGAVSLECNLCKSIFCVDWKYRQQSYCSVSCAKRDFMNTGNVASEMGKKSVSVQSKNRRSKNEIYFGELCKQKFNLVKFNEPMFNGWDADIIIPELKLAILWNGKWHYEKITNKHSVEQVQKRDEIKLKEIAENGYQHYVIKDMGKYDKKFVENKFQEMLVFLKL